MRLSLRFILPLALVLGLMAYAVVPLVDGLTLRWFIRDLDIRAALVANTMQEPLQEYLRSGSRSKTIAYFTKITQDERLFAIAFCDKGDAPLMATKTFPKAVTCRDLDRFADPQQHVLATERGPLHVSVQTIAGEDSVTGRLVSVARQERIHRRGIGFRQRQCKGGSDDQDLAGEGTYCQPEVSARMSFPARNNYVRAARDAHKSGEPAAPGAATPRCGGLIDLSLRRSRYTSCCGGIIE